MSADIHGGKIREASRLLGVPGGELLDFSANINFLGPSAQVLAAARRAVDEMGWYPLEPADPLRRAAAGFLGVPRERVLLGNGASELIFLLVAHLRPRRVAVLGPTFTEYERAARAWGAEVDVVLAPEERDFAYREEDVAGLASRISSADLVFLCDPNNPTGARWDEGARAALVSMCAVSDTYLFVDESFLAFTDGWPHGSVTRAVSPADEERVVVLHSFTKILAMPGLRVGALVVPETMVDGLSPRVPPWNVNCVAQAAALVGFEDLHLLDRTAEAVAEARTALASALADLSGVAAVLPAAANFLCLRLEQPAARLVTDRLLREHGVLVRDLSDFPGMGPSYLRVAVRDLADNERLTAALGEVLTGREGTRDRMLEAPRLRSREGGAR